jgi:hypothetical protein
LALELAKCVDDCPESDKLVEAFKGEPAPKPEAEPEVKGAGGEESQTLNKDPPATGKEPELIIEEPPTADQEPPIASDKSPRPDQEMPAPDSEPPTPDQ